MIDRKAGMRGIITGRGNSAGFTEGARALHKDMSHRRSRGANRRIIEEALADMQDEREERFPLYDFGSDSFCGDGCGDSFEQDERDDYERDERKRQKRLARRRELYRQRKIKQQVESFCQLSKELSKLRAKLEPESVQALVQLGYLTAHG